MQMITIIIHCYLIESCATHQTFRKDLKQTKTILFFMFDYLLKQEVDKNTLESERETAAAPVCLSRQPFVAVP